MLHPGLLRLAPTPTILPCPSCPVIFSQPFLNYPIRLPNQMMLPVRPRNPSPSQPGQIGWPRNMPRSTNSSSGKQRDPADPQELRPPVTAGDNRRRNSVSFESEPKPRRKNCVRAEPGGPRRLEGTKGLSQPGLGPGQSTPEGWEGAASGALAMCPGPALGEGTRKPWLQPWWPGAPHWRNREL